MARRRRNRSPLNLLTVLFLLTTVGLIGIIGLVLVNPSLMPAFFLPGGAADLVTVTALVIPPSETQAVTFPTLPPEWTATPRALPLPSRTPDRFPSATATTGPAATSLPNLNSTAEAGLDGQVSADVTFLRVRALAGTAGEVVGGLDALTPVQIIGRTPANDWLEIIAPDDTATPAGGEMRGWVMAQFVEVFINLQTVPVTAGAVLDATATPVDNFEARVKEDGDNLRLRATPGTAGFIQSFLPAGMILDLVGRTADKVWLQVVTSDNQRGWVMTQFVDVFINLDALPVTGTAVDATAVPTSQPASGAPAAATQVAAAPPTQTAPGALPPTATSTQPPPANTQPPPSGGAPPPGDLVFGISDHARQIFQAGQALGNQANVFAKVGDSITVSPQFLLPIGYNQYDLRGYGYLAEAVNFFRGGWARTGNAFINTSLAAKGGWSTFSVLAPSQSDKSYCYANESPLACEYRLSKPAVALIMLGTNDVLSTNNDAYVANLRRIVSDSLAVSVIPVLSTIPPFLWAGYEGRAEELNSLIVAVAQENDLPVWNYWAALQPLPNRGMGPDGVHPSWAPNAADFTAENLQYGSTMRNLTALIVLDALWRQVMN
jgi:lysophospholipase L1-like esterase